jgi:hypothetical protein
MINTRYKTVAAYIVTGVYLEAFFSLNLFGVQGLGIHVREGRRLSSGTADVVEVPVYGRGIVREGR